VGAAKVPVLVVDFYVLPPMYCTKPLQIRLVQTLLAQL
jgi:hypothetical protein